MKTSYLQSSQHVSEYSDISWWKKTSKIDLCYLFYGLTVVVLVILSYILGNFGWLPHDPEEMALDSLMAGPSAAHWLGTDYLGRDILTRLILGIQAYFLPGLLAIFISIFLGSLFGVISGFNAGWLDRSINYFNNLVDSLPRLVLILLVLASFKPDIYIAMAIIGLTNAPRISVLIKSKILFLKQRNFIESAVAGGIPTWSIIVKHILWYNCRSLLIIQATICMGEAILMETSLSYLGFGVQEPTPSWGNMVQAGSNYLLQGDFWSSSVPAAAILFTVLGFHLLGDGLNNILEGKSR